jgi:hypothetical protein
MILAKIFELVGRNFATFPQMTPYVNLVLIQYLNKLTTGKPLELLEVFV